MQDPCSSTDASLELLSDCLHSCIHSKTISSSQISNLQQERAKDIVFLSYEQCVTIVECIVCPMKWFIDLVEVNGF